MRNLTDVLKSLRDILVTRISKTSQRGVHFHFIKNEVSLSHSSLNIIGEIDHGLTLNVTFIEMAMNSYWK